MRCYRRARRRDVEDLPLHLRLTIAVIRASEPTSAYVKEMDRVVAMATERRAHRLANLMYIDRTRSFWDC